MDDPLRIGPRRHRIDGPIERPAVYGHRRRAAAVQRHVRVVRTRSLRSLHDVRRARARGRVVRGPADPVAEHRGAARTRREPRAGAGGCRDSGRSARQRVPAVQRGSDVYAAATGACGHQSRPPRHVRPRRLAAGGRRRRRAAGRMREPREPAARESRVAVARSRGAAGAGREPRKDRPAARHGEPHARAGRRRCGARAGVVDAALALVGAASESAAGCLQPLAGWPDSPVHARCLNSRGPRLRPAAGGSGLAIRGQHDAQGERARTIDRLAAAAAGRARHRRGRAVDRGAHGRGPAAAKSVRRRSASILVLPSIGVP